MSKQVNNWCKTFTQKLKGKTIKEIRSLTPEETGFYSSCFMIVFTDGSIMFPMADDEGNDAGVLNFQNGKGDGKGDLILFRH